MQQELTLDKRIETFKTLGKVLGIAALHLEQKDDEFAAKYTYFDQAIIDASYKNPWFTIENIQFALKAWNKALAEDSFDKWLYEYSPFLSNRPQKKVAVIMAGNIPFVGFHDFLCTLIAGHYCIAKLSSGDNLLLPLVSELLCGIEPLFKPYIEFSEGLLKNFDAVIATGSNNTARYFEYYFSSYPHIIRKNRNGVAVLTGAETDAQLVKLGNDICMYFGLGCRNVSKIFIPTGTDPTIIFKSIEPFNEKLFNHFKYMNNHSYYRSVFLLNQTPHFDNGVILLTESDQYSSPIPVIYYEFYNDEETLASKMHQDKDQIQCIVKEGVNTYDTIGFGDTQNPGLGDYADGIDTLKFLTEL